MSVALLKSQDRSPLEVVDFGTVSYAPIYDLQLRLVAREKKALRTQDTLLLLEHRDVYTYGRKTKFAPLLAGAEVFSVERGGEITFHNPGQLVAYPILKLQEGERDLHLHLRRLETVLIRVLAEFGIEGERRVGATGVWVVGKGKKIASIGVAVSSWVTYHGCALNVCNDLSGFSRISPCGFSSEVMTSMAEQLGEAPGLTDVKTTFLKFFAEEFNREVLHPDILVR